MSKLIFVLSYAEGDLFIRNYRKEFFPADAQVIILDNGHQANLRQWAEANGAWYHESENNLGTTGGYNWFIRVGNLLKADRAVVMQADVEILRADVFDLLFNPNWKPWDFAYFPNLPRQFWNPNNGYESDIGQLFSIDPKFWLEAEWLCDENYTITHFESIDLFNRIVSERNPRPAIAHNLIYENSKSPEEDSSYYRHHSISSGSGEHNPWFDHNYRYWKKKWGYHTEGKTSDDGWKDFTKETMDWATSPWINREDYWSAALLNRWTLDPRRNIAVGQVPYPVEHEVNRFYSMIREKLSP